MLKLPLISDRFSTNLSGQSTAVTLISKDQKGPNAQIQSNKKKKNQGFQSYDTDGFTTKRRAGSGEMFLWMFLDDVS